jgi:hypothetical protein
MAWRYPVRRTASPSDWGCVLRLEASSWATALKAGFYDGERLMARGGIEPPIQGAKTRRSFTRADSRGESRRERPFGV